MNEKSRLKILIGVPCIVLVLLAAVVALAFLLSLPSVYGFAVPKWLASVAFGWTNVFNNGFFR